MTEIKACPFCGASEPCYKHEPVEVRNDADDPQNMDKGKHRALEEALKGPLDLAGAAHIFSLAKGFEKKAAMTDDLKARLQAGETGPGVDLMFHRWLTGKDWERAGVVWRRADGEEILSIRYTTSIDAAMGAVPEGWKFMIFALEGGLVTVDLDAKSGGSFGYGEANNSVPCAILLAVIDARENQ